MAGAAIHEMNILAHDIHIILSHPSAAKLNPIIAAMMVCVVDTGNPYAVANINQKDAFTNATNIPNANTS